MLSMQKKLFLFLILTLPALHPSLDGQSVTFNGNIEWINAVHPDGLPFKGEGDLVDSTLIYRFKVPMPDNVDPATVEVVLNDIVWETSQNLPNVKFPSEMQKANSIVTYIRKQAWLEAEITPVRNQNGSLERVSNFSTAISYQLKPIDLLKSASQAAGYELESKLASGLWIKISVEESGIHRIPYTTLSSWGFSSPSKVGVFGNGGQMMPRVNNVDRPDDLPQIAVWHHNNALYFYANDLISWEWNSTRNMFTHKLHYWETKSFYFLSETDNLKTIEIQPEPIGAVGYATDHYDDRRVHENEARSLIRSGRKFYGEEFTVSRNMQATINFNFPTRDTALPVRILAAAAGRSGTTNRFEFFANSQSAPVLNLTIPSVVMTNYDGLFAQEREESASFSIPEQNLSIRIEYKDQNVSSLGWLDYINLNARSHLRMTGSQLLFRDIESQQASLTRFRIENPAADTRVWNISDILNPFAFATTTENNKLVFTAESSTYQEYVAFNPAGQLPVPARIGTVPNQNLHSIHQTDYVIVSPSEFISYAQQLAALHQTHNNLSSVIITPEQIYNEFSWGHQDPTAIRSFLRMLYERAGTNADMAPKYLLLFGNGYYDNRSTSSNANPKIVTYQSENSIHRTNSYVTDDYFGFLDLNEGLDDRFDRLDIGIGRFPVRNTNDAKIAVDKVRAYLENQATGKWRKLVTFLADDEDFNIHMRDADFMAQKIENNHEEFDIRKIYLDNYPKVTVANGKQTPEAKDLVDRTISEGTILFNYVGHGSVNGLTAEQVITTTGIKRWNNIRTLPLFVTATCEFSRFDDPLKVSAGEEVFLNPNGGGIALLSTTRVVYSSLNFQLNNAFFNFFFYHKDNGEKPAFGDILRNTKNSSGSSVNKLNFTLLGDPALKLIYPENSINTLSINYNPISETPDTLKALSQASVQGEVTHRNGQRIEDFNGDIDIVVYDKQHTVKTRGNDGATPFEFNQYANILFKGKASVTNGLFDAEFTIPFDIRYNYGFGKISYSATSPQHGNAFGAFKDFVVGGMNFDAEDDNEGPTVNLYLNHTGFKPGDVTGHTPLLYADIFDKSGINTSGNGIGHDIMLILNGNHNAPIILNDNFQAKLNSYQEGTITYQLPFLPAGRHELSLRVWDNFNNSTTVETQFIVGAGEELSVRDFKWYPNPIYNSGTGYVAFEMDEPNSALTILAEAIGSDGTTTGRHRFTVVAQGNFVDEVPVNLSRLGIRSPGFYFIRFTIKTDTGKETQVVEKILVRP
jgi:hypothetical protein